MSPKNFDKDEMLSTKEVASWLKIDPTTLEFWRKAGRGPACSKLAPGPTSPVRYRRSDIEKWLTDCRVKPKRSRTK
jgi:predicted DNA-binding transcriptional regulator AlpA